MDKKLRIAIFEPARISATGGGQKIAAKVAKHLSKKYYVEVFTQKLPHKSLDFGQAKITLIKPANRFLAVFAFFMKRARGFDLVFTGEFPSSLAAFRNSPSINICASPTRALYDLRKYLWKNSGMKGKLKIFVKNILFYIPDQLAARKTTKFLAISNNIQKRVLKYYARDSDIFYIGIDTSKYRFNKYGNFILSVSRLVNAKRIDVLIKSMELVKNKKIKLYIVGDGEDEEKLKKLAGKYSNIVFLGEVSDKKLIDLYANCLAKAYIPVEEDWGLVPIEAGASQKATLGVNEGGLKETIVDGKTGFLLDKATPKTVAEKIDLLANDKKLAEKIGKAAKKYSDSFDWKNTLPAIDNAIKDILISKK